MKRLSGIIAAAPSPVRPDLSIDGDRLVEHCRWLLGAGGCDGVNLLGTTGEATSFSVAQRIDAMQAVAESGLPLERIMVGTGAAALEDATRLTAAACDLGFAGSLLLPPFYFKDIDGPSLVAYVDRIVQQVGASRLRLYLYHFPQNTGVPYPLDVVRTLRDRHPETLIGLKDSSGDLAYARTLARTLPGFDVFPSSEGSVGEARRSGFAGCISATTNVNATLARVGWLDPDSEPGRRSIAEAVAIREALARFPLVASVHWALADLKADAAWEQPSPPLRRLLDIERSSLAEHLSKTAYPRLKSLFAPGRTGASPAHRLG